MRHIAVIGSLTAALLLAAAPSAFADDIGRDIRDIRHDRADIRHDEAVLHADRADRNYDLGREVRAIEHGNLRAAERWDATRRYEQHQINAFKRDLRQDRWDLARDRADLRRDLKGW
jgi:hypothetical protein